MLAYEVSEDRRDSNRLASLAKPETNMITREEAQKLAQRVLAMSTFPDCQVSINSQEQAYTRFANNGITTASFALRHTVSITTTRDDRTGSYASNDLDEASLLKAVKKA